MEVRKTYIADDGTEFDDCEECLVYEEKGKIENLKRKGIRVFDCDFNEAQCAEEIEFFHVFHATEENYEALAQYFKYWGVCFDVSEWMSGTYKYNENRYIFENITKICIDMETNCQAVLKAIEIDTTK